MPTVNKFVTVGIIVIESLYNIDIKIYPFDFQIYRKGYIFQGG